MENIFLIKDYITNGFTYEIVDVLFFLSTLFGILIIVSKNPIISVLFLIGLFLCISVLLISYGFIFIGLSYILVYVGAVSILFLFILMLINIRISELLNENNNDIPLAIILIMLLFYEITEIIPSNYNNNVAIFSEWFNNFSEEIVYVSSKGWDNSLVDITQITAIGNVLYTNYAIWLIIASMILLLAMVGAIVITIKQRKYINM